MICPTRSKLSLPAVAGLALGILFGTFMTSISASPALSPQDPVPCSPGHPGQTATGIFCSSTTSTCTTHSAGDCDATPAYCSHLGIEARASFCGPKNIGGYIEGKPGSTRVITGFTGPFVVDLAKANLGCGLSTTRTVTFYDDSNPAIEIGSVTFEYDCGECPGE